MNNKIPPPIIGIVAAIIAYFVNRLFSSWQFDWQGLPIIALLLFLAGLSIDLYSVFLFFKARTTVNPLKPAKANTLVIDGLFRYSRNPMYLGMLLMLSGLVVWLGNPASVIALALFVLYINRFQIKPEEQALEQNFGQQFSQYKARVRRWL